MQHSKVIAYFSRQLKVYEKNYLTQELELAAVVFALKILRYSPYGVYVDAFTDNKSLLYLFNKKDLSLCQRRWLELLKDYDMSVLHYHGKPMWLWMHLVVSSWAVCCISKKSKGS